MLLSWVFCLGFLTSIIEKYSLESHFVMAKRLCLTSPLPAALTFWSPGWRSGEASDTELPVSKYSGLRCSCQSAGAFATSRTLLNSFQSLKPEASSIQPEYNNFSDQLQINCQKTSSFYCSFKTIAIFSAILKCKDLFTAPA